MDGSPEATLVLGPTRLSMGPGERPRREVAVPEAQDESARGDLSTVLLDALPTPVALLDADGTVLHTNAAWRRSAVAGGPSFTVAVGEDYVAAAARGDSGGRLVADGVLGVLAGLAGEFRHDHRHCSGRWWQVHVVPADDSGRAVVVHSDVTERVDAERRAAYDAAHDHLTMLPNRAALHEVIRQAMAAHHSRAVSVLYMDVDGFKRINDLRGHSVGDVLLRQLADRLARLTRPTDVVGRLGGDEFVVVARDCDATGGAALAARFRAAFDEPFDLGGARVSLTTSIGIATCDTGHATPDDLLRDADVAMYAAKSGGPDRWLAFTPDMRGWLQDRWRLALASRGAAAAER